MHLRPLTDTPLPDIVDCLLDAFRDYPLAMPRDVDYWRRRYRGARVDFACSFGAFDAGGTLVAFIIHGVDDDGGSRVAFNTGTGVRERARGRALVDALYAFAKPRLAVAGVTDCRLEVIASNARAIRVYERLGFRVRRRLRCFGGELSQKPLTTGLTRVSLGEVLDGRVARFAWDYRNAGVRALAEHYEGYRVEVAEGTGAFVIDEAHGTIAQLHVDRGDAVAVLRGVRALTSSVRVNNVDAGAADWLDAIGRSGLRPTVEQYEMGVPLTGLRG